MLYLDTAMIKIHVETRGLIKKNIDTYSYDMADISVYLKQSIM